MSGRGRLRAQARQQRWVIGELDHPLAQWHAAIQHLRLGRRVQPTREQVIDIALGDVPNRVARSAGRAQIQIPAQHEWRPGRPS
jgi:hypothetical protein